MDPDVSRIKVRVGDQEYELELRDFTAGDYRRVFGSPQPWDIPPTFVWARDWKEADRQPASRSMVEMRRVNGTWQRA